MDSLADLGVAPAAFEALIAAAERPVLVEFWGPWCGACRLMAPSMFKLKAEMGDTIDIVTLNVEDGQDVALAHGVLSLPTVIAFRGGKEVKRLNGMKSYANLLAEAQALAAS